MFDMKELELMYLVSIRYHLRPDEAFTICKLFTQARYQQTPRVDTHSVEFDSFHSYL